MHAENTFTFGFFFLVIPRESRIPLGIEVVKALKVPLPTPPVIKNKRKINEYNHTIVRVKKKGGMKETP